MIANLLARLLLARKSRLHHWGHTCQTSSRTLLELLPRTNLVHVPKVHSVLNPDLSCLQERSSQCMTEPWETECRMIVAKDNTAPSVTCVFRTVRSKEYAKSV